jgi:hypothetical protein
MNKTTRILSSTLAIGSLLVLAGCAKYKSQPLPPLNHASSTQGVSLAYRTLNVTESKMYLGRDLLKKGYQPVQITITNSTNNTYQVTPSSLSLPVVNAELVAEKAHTNTTGRAVGYGTAAVLSCGLFAIPAIVDGIGSAKANDKLDMDYSSKMLRLDGVIRPHSSLNGIVFVPRGAYNGDFTFTVTDAKSGEKLELSSTSDHVDVK